LHSDISNFRELKRSFSSGIRPSTWNSMAPLEASKCMFDSFSASTGMPLSLDSIKVSHSRVELRRPPVMGGLELREEPELPVAAFCRWRIG
jgi:hypothetical protein